MKKLNSYSQFKIIDRDKVEKKVSINSSKSPLLTLPPLALKTVSLSHAETRERKDL